MLFIFLRDRRGRVYGVLATSPPRSDVRVPSLGDFVDVFVDAFGYEDVFISILFNARLRARDADDWVHSVAHIMSITEAMWFYRYINIPTTRTYRERSYELWRF